MSKIIGKVPADKLTHVFLFGNKECLVGKYDPTDPHLNLSSLSFEQLGTELLFQIQNSGIFTLNEMENIAMMPAESFLACIIKL